MHTQIPKNTPQASTLLDRFEELRRTASGMIRPLGIARLQHEPKLFPQQRGKFDWLILRIEDDPLFEDGALSIPAAQLRKLEQLEAKVEFDGLLIAHEIRKGIIDSSKPMSSSEAATALRLQADLPFLTADKAVRRIQESAALLARTAFSAMLSPILALASADPVLIGYLSEDGTSKQNTRAIYFELARWK